MDPFRGSTGTMQEASETANCGEHDRDRRRFRPLRSLAELKDVLLAHRKHYLYRPRGWRENDETGPRANPPNKGCFRQRRDYASERNRSPLPHRA